MSIISDRVNQESDGTTVRSFLKSHMGLSTRLIRSAAKDERIKVNGKVCRMNLVLKAGDSITVETSKDESQNIEPENIPIDILYENEDLLVVNKPPFMVCHPTRSHQTGTLANAVLYYFKETGENAIVRLVNRLDMNTSGIVIIAKNQYAHMFLSKEMQQGNFKKHYKALVSGRVEKAFGTLDLPIYRPLEDSIKRIVDERGQRSITHYRVLEASDSMSFLELSLETGRTHQIRVHLSYLGHPILGDTLYGQEQPELIERQALHAFEVQFVNPRTSELLTIEAKLPEDMDCLVKKYFRT